MKPRSEPARSPLETDRILSFTYDAVRVTVHRDYERLIELSLIRPSRRDEKGELTEQPITPKSWRKYGFNMIDACVDVSPEWRKMLKGRDLSTERYYSRENVEALRKITELNLPATLDKRNQRPIEPASENPPRSSHETAGANRTLTRNVRNRPQRQNPIRYLTHAYACFKGWIGGNSPSCLAMIVLVTPHGRDRRFLEIQIALRG